MIRGAHAGIKKTKIGRPEDVKAIMKWTRSVVLGLAQQTCTFCFGRGMRTGKRSDTSPCPCVLRHIYRVCYARFCHCLDKEKHISQISLNRIPGSKRGISFGRKDEEFMADFLLTSRRYLDRDETRVFKAHLLLGADWRLCCRQLNLDKGEFFHFVYRIMHKLGKVFAELKPYPLYPLEAYYDVHCGVDLPVLTAQARAQRRRNQAKRGNGSRPIVPPLRTAA